MKQNRIFFFFLAVLGLLSFAFPAQSQTTTNTSGGLSIQITVSNPCGGSNNGFIQFKVLSSTGQAKLQVLGPVSLLVQTSFPGSGIYIHNPTKTLPAGTYNYLIVDDVDVVSTTALGGTFPALPLTALPAIVINTNSLINNANCTTPNGNVVASITGGSKTALAPTPGSFTYTWSANVVTAGLPLTATYDGTGNLDLTALLGHGLPGGIYTLLIVDNYSVCTQTQNFTIADPLVTFTTVKTDVTGCFGNNNGSITVTGSGGSGSYTYSKDNGVTFQVSNIFSSLTANTYQIIIKDGTGCLSTATGVTISQPPAVTFTDVKTDVTCNGGADGTITITPAGGSGAGYTFSDDNGATFQASNVFNGLAANTYQVKVKDGAGCISAATGVTIAQPPAVAFTFVKTNVTCNGGANGTITITPSGGSGAGYTYSDDNGATFQASNVFNGLVANTYQIKVKDGAGCISAATGVTITAPTAVTFTFVKTDVICNGGATGTITVTPSGGSGAGYTYSKNNGATFQASNIFNGLAANTYQIKVKDGAGCISAATGVVIGQPTAVTFTFVKTDATCNGIADGTITVTPSGGSGAGYTYSKNNGATFQASNVFNGLAANTYQLKVKDGAGCISAATGVTITQPTAVTFTFVKTDATCNGGLNGTITITPSGGSGAGYTFSDDNGATFQASNVFNGLAANTYQVKVKDGAGCISTATGVTIAQPPAVTFTDVKTDASCNGVSDGTITVTPAGGSGAGYTFSDDNGATFQASSVFNGLAANTYQVKVKDGAGCISAATGVTIAQPPAVTFTDVKTDASCNGVSDGTITITPSGGSGAGYTFSDDNGTTFQASNVFNSLAANTYQVKVKDGAGCISAATGVVVGQPTAVTFTVAKTNVTCNGGVDGTVTITPSGGSGAGYTFSDDNGATFQASNVFNSLAANTYQVKVKDGAGCISAATGVTITQPTAVTFTFVKTDATCNGGLNGTITITPSGGSGAGYTFSDDNGATFQASNAFNGLAANTYQVKVKDGAGCISAATGVTIAQPPAVTFTDVKADASCNGVSDGTITITPAGGSGAGYTFSDDNGATFQASNVFNGLAANTYQVKVKDGAGCISAATGVTIGQPPAVTFTDVKTDASCNGVSDGTITVTPAGGSGAGYTFSDDNGATFQASNVFNGLAANTYQVKVKDGAGCISAATGVTIGQPPAVTFTDVKTDASCNGVSDGTITVTPAGGSGAGYTFSDDNGATFQASNVFNGLAANTYQVKVKDGAGCISAATGVTIAQPPAVTFTDVKTDASCNGVSDGTITVTPAGGSGAGYTFSDDNGATFQASNVFNGLAANTYQVKVKDGAGCISAATGVAIAQPPSVTFTDVKADVTCNGGVDGTITITPAGGSGAGYTYSDDNGATFQASNIFNALAPNTYQIVVKDGNGCLSTATGVTIGQPATVKFSNAKTDVTCNGGVDGTITITPSGGSGAGYIYSDDNGVTFQASNAFNGLAPNTYQIVVKDGNGCLSAATGVTIGQPATVTFTDAKTDVTCNGGTDGTITVTASGGSGAGYTYSKDNGATFQASNVFNSLAPNTYQIVVKDGNGCLAAATGVTIGQPTIVTFTFVKTDVTCNGGADGTIAVTGSGGSGSYTYSKDNGTTFQAGNTFTVTAGSYQVVVKDGNSCVSAASTVTINQPTAITFTTSKVDVTTCVPGNDGSVTVNSPTGGSGAGYTYSNDNGVTFQAGNSFATLTPGNYLIVVKDGSGCVSGAVSVTINSASGLSFTTTQQNVLCNGGSNGSITITTVGGSGTYTYSKDNGATFSGSGSPFTFSSLIAATYPLVVKDGNGCQFSGSVIVTEPVVLSFITSKTDVSCNGGSDGTITVTPSGGTSAYQYSKDGGATFQAGNLFSGLNNGSYNIVVKDANNCITSSTPVSISQPAVLSFSTTKTDATTCSSNDGTITVTASGGTSAYQYSVDNGTTFQGSNIFSSLAPASYNVVVKDANNCLTPASLVSIGAPGGLTFTTSKTDATCNGTSDGTITVTASGGTGPYQYSSDNGATFQASNILGSLSAATYPVVAKDVNGCQFSSSVTIAEPSAVTFTFAKVDASCAAADGSITITASGGNNVYTYSKDNGVSFQLGNAFTSLAAQTYPVVVKDGNGCLSSASSVVIGSGTMTPNFTKTDATCAANDGSIVVNSVTGGTAPFQYSIDNGVTYQSPSNTFSNLTVATYSLVTKDVNGCTSSAVSVVISKPGSCGGTNCGAFTISATDTRPTCSGQDDGTITISVSGGTPNYTVTLSDPAHGFSQATAGPGPFTFGAGPSGGLSPSLTYQYTILDNAGNTCTLPYSLPIQTNVSASAAGFVDAKCFNQAVGQAIVTVSSGGTSPYEYSLDAGVTWTSFTSPVTITNLMPALTPYSILVRDDASDLCPAQVSVTINNAVTDITTSFTTTDVSCSNNDGTIQVGAVSGGTAPYTFRLDSVDYAALPASNTFTGLAGGLHKFTVIDANGCNKYFKTTINNAVTNITTSLTATDASCTNNDGTIQVGAVSGGTAPYTFRLDSLDYAALPANNTFTGLDARTHKFTVIDAKGCSKYFKTTINFPGLVNFSTIFTDPDCSGGGTNGSIVATITSSGTFDVGITNDPSIDPTVFQTVVSAGFSQVTFIGISQGTYIVVAKPVGALCPSHSAPIFISGGPAAVDFNIIPEDFMCFEAKGIVKIAAIKGSTLVDYNYEIIFEGNIIQSGTITKTQALADTINFTGLDKGNYQMRLFQDQSVVSGCASPISSSYKSFSINGPAASLDTLYVNRKFSLPNIATGAMLIGIQESQEQPYQLMLHLVKPHLQGQKNNYAFDSTWVSVSRNNQNLIMEFNAANIYGGDYRLSIRDTLGCTRTYDLTLDFDEDIYIPNVFTPNNDGKNDTFQILNLPNDSDSQLVITNRWGKEVYRSSKYTNNWNGGAEVDGVYYYSLNAGGKTYTGWVEIMHPSY